MSAEHIAEFLTYAERDRNRSTHTLMRYRATFATVEPFGDLTTITVGQVQAWWESRFHLSPGTRSNELACLRALFKWMSKYDYRTDDPTRRLDPPKVPNKVPRPIGKADLDRLLGTLTEDALDLRRAVALGAYGGLRVSEAAGLDWRNVDIEGRRIYVRGKGQKERLVPLNPLTLDIIAPNTGGNVVAAGGRGVSGATLQRKINRFMGRHGIDHSFHDCRKRGATIALAKGASPVAIKQIYGWSSMETVASYALVADEELDRVGELMIG